MARARPRLRKFALIFGVASAGAGTLCALALFAVAGALLVRWLLAQVGTPVVYAVEWVLTA